MIKAARLFLVLLLLAACCGADTAKVRPNHWAQPVIASSLENFYKVSEELYRSEQPESSDIHDLKALGIQTAISLRHYHQDSREFTRAGIRSVHYPMDAGSVSVPDLIAVLRLIRTAPKPVLLHCWRGSDRTGFIVAGYRVVLMNWTSAEAIEELRLGGFGHHESLYPNIARVLSELDVSAVRNAVLTNSLPDGSASGNRAFRTETNRTPSAAVSIR